MKRQIILGVILSLIAYGGDLAYAQSKKPPKYMNEIRELSRYSRLFRYLGKKTGDAVVLIQTKSTNRSPLPYATPYNNFDADPYVMQGEETYHNQLASGVLVSQSGYIVTSYQRIKQADTLQVVFNQRVYRAKVVGSDPISDISLLKISSKRPFPFLVYGNSNGMFVGDWVVSVGRSIGGELSVLPGNISANPNSRLGRLIENSTVLNEMNAGGALVDLRGELIGINTPLLSGEKNTGLGMAIPGNYVKRIVGDLIKNGRVIRGWVGINYHSNFDKSGVIVSNVIKDSPADAAGIKRGDIITHFDQTRVSSASDLRYFIEESSIDSEHTLKIRRRKKSMVFTVSVKASPETVDQISDPPQVDILGLILEERVDIEGNRQLFVIEIEPESTGNKSGFKVGDHLLEINKDAYLSLEQYDAFIEDQQPGAKLQFLINREGNPLYITVVVE